jgi:hypothetical protein
MISGNKTVFMKVFGDTYSYFPTAMWTHVGSKQIAFGRQNCLLKFGIFQKILKLHIQ